MFSKFCNKLAENMNKQTFVICSQKDLIKIADQLDSALPIILREQPKIDDPHHSFWSDIYDLMNQIPYAILFFNVSNLSCLSEEKKYQILITCKKQVSDLGLRIDQYGFNYSTSGESGIIFLLENHNHPDGKQVPDNFKVVALINTYNEEDIIVPNLEGLIAEGIEAYVIDNWSSDMTYELLDGITNINLLGVERYPKSGPTDIYSEYDLLIKKEELTKKLEADWFIHLGADEINESPWPGLTFREALWKIDQMGYSALDLTVLNFYPIDNNFIPGSSHKEYFNHFAFGQAPGSLKQIKVWKNQPEQVNLHQSGGHIVTFTNRSVFPYKGILRHYPFRSQYHAERKVFKERKSRYSPEERQKGWHTHYDQYEKGVSFLKEPGNLIEMKESFYPSFLIERLTGIGIHPLSKTNFDYGLDYNILQKMNEKEKNILKLKLKRQRKQLISQRQEIEHLENEIKQKEEEINFYSHSKSWKLTQPFRNVMKIFKKDRK